METIEARISLAYYLELIEENKRLKEKYEKLLEQFAVTMEEMVDYIKELREFYENKGER